MGSGLPYEFCTPVTLGYVPRALVLYRSLADVCPSFRLHAFCMDEATKVLLDRMSLSAVVTVSREELEGYDPALGAVRPSRTDAEYCWTAKATMCRFVFDREPNVQTIAYADADLMFFRDPGPLFEELGRDSVLVVPHRFPPGRGWEETYGEYNAGFVAFRHDQTAEAVLSWWRERCLEWCYARAEKGRLWDQKYLDEWPRRFPGVHVLRHPGGGLAPWNTVTHRLTKRDGSVTVDGQPLIFFHYQSLRLYNGLTLARRLGLLSNAYGLTPDPVPLVWAIDDYPTSGFEEKVIWEPYLRQIGAAIVGIRRIDPEFSAGMVRPSAGDVAKQAARQALPGPARRFLRRGWRLVRGIFPENIIAALSFVYSLFVAGVGLRELVL